MLWRLFSKLTTLLISVCHWALVYGWATCMSPHRADSATFAAGSVVDEAPLRAQGLVKGVWDGIKVLGDGKLSKKLTVNVSKASQTAKDAIAKAGGVLTELGLVTHKEDGLSRANGRKRPKAEKAAKAKA